MTPINASEYSMNRPFQLTAVALSASVLAACGGGGGSAERPPTAAVLAVSTESLTLVTSGTARRITVSNQGDLPILALEATAAGLPEGSSLEWNCPAELEGGASCDLVITPGAIPTAVPGHPAPAPGTVQVTSSNTPGIDVPVSVLTYGSLHQGGYVFALNDTTASTTSAEGKVLSTADLASWSVWSPTLVAIPGVSDNSAAGPDSCDGAVDGRCNTARILSTYPSAGRDFAAAQCADHRDGGFTDWYLPALCELTYGSSDPANPEQALCGTPSNPLLADNARSRLYDQGLFGTASPLWYWSSTQRSLNEASNAAAARFALGANAFPLKDATSLPVRCARAISP